MSWIHKPSRKIVLLVAGAGALVFVGIIVGFIVLLSGAYSTAATTQHFRVTHRLLDIGLRYSVRTSARNIQVPRLDSPGTIERGTACYSAYCVQCHGAPGGAIALDSRAAGGEPRHAHARPQGCRRTCT